MKRLLERLSAWLDRTIPAPDRWICADCDDRFFDLWDAARHVAAEHPQFDSCTLVEPDGIWRVPLPAA